MAVNTFEGEIKGRGAMGFSGCDISLVVRLPGYSSADGKEKNPDKVYRLGTLQTLSISTYNSKTPVRALGFKNPIAVARGGRTIAGTMILNQMHSHVFDENNFGAGGWKKFNDDGFLTYGSGDVEYFLARQNDLVNNEETNASALARQGLFESPAEVALFMGNAKKKELINKNNSSDPNKWETVPFPGQAPVDTEKQKKQWDYSWDTSMLGQRMKPSDLPPFDIILLFLNEAGNGGKIILYGVDIVHDSQTLSVEDIYTEVQYQYIARDIEYFDSIDALEGVERSKGLLASTLTSSGITNSTVQRIWAENQGATAAMGKAADTSNAAKGIVDAIRTGRVNAATQEENNRHDALRRIQENNSKAQGWGRGAIPAIGRQIPNDWDQDYSKGVNSESAPPVDPFGPAAPPRIPRFRE
jgi:hypothetical protein